ncbi:MAG: RNA polymerase sigma factor [Bacteroidales bacterium]|nr:RNA polymerase sigma factor [Bacteroidales bacterium]
MAKGDYTDQELIDGCLRGKRKFQELLYRQFYAFAMSVSLRYAPSREDALEVINDSFFKVFSNLESYQHDKPFKTWFRRILVNTSLDHYRSNKRLALFREAEPEVLETMIEPAFENDMSAEEILRLFERLPDLYRLIFNLYEVEGYNHEEIAGLLDVSPGTSRSHLSRAKKMLRELYVEKILNKRHEAV